jgi:hypothetical protein
MTEKEMHSALIAPFEAYYVQWKPQTVKGNQALAVAYVDARTTMDRLDAVFGGGGWSDEYLETSRGSLKCRLHTKWGDEWTFHEGFGEAGGGQGIDPDKSAESDSFKRAAVKVGVGRYLYRIPGQWVDCELKPNGKFKRFKRKPQLPDWALPKVDPGPPRPAKSEQPETEPEKPKMTGPHAARELGFEDGIAVEVDLDYIPSWIDTDKPRQWGKLYYEARRLGFTNDFHVQGALAKVYNLDEWDTDAAENYHTAWNLLAQYQRSKEGE